VLYVFFRVVAVAIVIAKSGREETPPLPHPQPLGRDAKRAEFDPAFGDVQE
jgi:hypothetical protein